MADERCGAYYGHLDSDGEVRGTICHRSEGHPPISEDRIGHSPIPLDIGGKQNND